MPNTVPALRASGTVNPYRFVKLSGTTLDNQGAQCGAAGIAIGISRGTNRDFTDPAHALAGDMIELQPEGGDMYLEVDATTDILVGDLLKSDANGKGVKAVATNQAYAQALENATDDLVTIRVKWQPQVA